MARVRDLDFKLRAFIGTYPWRRIPDPIPRAVRGKPIRDCRVALVSSAGLVAPGDAPFDPTVRGGDFSHRVIPSDVDVQRLEEHHRSHAFDHAGIEADRNMGLPLDRLHDLFEAGEIGGLAPRHVSVMGSITAPGRLLKKTVPSIVDLLVSDQVDLALLVPV